MKRIIKLMDESIDKLKKLIPDEHKMNCNTCGQEMDMRDLSQVFAHEECDGIPINYEKIEQIPHSSSKKINEMITWSDAKWWQLPLK